LRGGLLGAAAGEALGLPWVGRGPREISARRLYEGVGPTGPLTATLLRGRGDGLAGALALGWRERDPMARRREALHLGFAPVMLADLAAWALEGRPLFQLVVDHADDWPPPFHGVPLDDRAIVDALLAVLHRHDAPADGIRSAVRLGGAATAVLGGLVGGLLGCRYPAAARALPWLERVALPSDAELNEGIGRLGE
jgi:hypothetical protein